MNKIALVTGGSRGLGRNMAENLADRGVDVVLTYRDRGDEAEEVVQQIRARGRKAAALQLDVGQSQTFSAFVEHFTRTLGTVWQRDRFDFLVNNAGVALYQPIADTREEQFDELTNIHFKGPFFLTQKLLPLLRDGGRILNVSSGLARFSSPGSSVYGALKGAIEVFTRYLALELGPRGITVNVVAPGPIETDFGGGRVRDTPELNRILAGQTALGRVGVADDIGPVVAMLLSDDARWINGQRIEVSGGIHL